MSMSSTTPRNQSEASAGTGDEQRLQKFSKMNAQLALLVEKLTKENTMLRYQLKDAQFSEVCHGNQASHAQPRGSRTDRGGAPEAQHVQLHEERTTMLHRMKSQLESEVSAKESLRAQVRDLKTEVVSSRRQSVQLESDLRSLSAVRGLCRTC